MRRYEEKGADVMENENKKITTGKSVAVLIVSLAVLLYLVAVLKANPGVSLILSALVAIGMGMLFGCTWKEF